jgi:general secretion pathway protein K
MLPVTKSAGHQQGVVLLSVLLILALLSALIYQLVGQHGLVIAQARQTFAGDQALSYALGGETFARQLLYEDWSQSGQGVDTLQEAWAQPLAPYDVDNGFLEVQIRDLNSCFNLNSLLDTPGSGDNDPSGLDAPEDPAGAQAGQPTGRRNPAADNLQRLKTLLRNLNLPESLADVWLDWIDPDEELTGFGAEDGEYLLNEQPYRTANQAVTHVSELALLKDMEPEYLQVLSQYTCVLPATELKLNVNTASAAALAALNPALTEVQMLGLTEAVREYDSVAAVTAEYPDLLPAASALAVTSEYFEIRVRAQVDDSLVELASVLHRDPENGTISLIMRDFGKTFRSLFADSSEQAAAS